MKTTANAAAILALVTARPMTAPQVAAELGIDVPADVLMFDCAEVDAIDEALCALVTARAISARKVAFADEWATYGTAEALGVDAIRARGQAFGIRGGWVTMSTAR